MVPLPRTPSVAIIPGRPRPGLHPACALALVLGAATCAGSAGGAAPVVPIPTERIPSAQVSPDQVSTDSGTPDQGTGVFLPATDGAALWQRTVAAVAADWPVVRVVEPDFLRAPPRAGLLESAWVEPPDTPSATWPPRRQRLVVQVLPDGRGAWLDAAVETQSLGAAEGGVEPAAGWLTQPAPDDVTLRLAAVVSPTIDPVVPLPALDRETFAVPGSPEPPWAGSRFPRAARFGFKVLEDYRNFYSCEGLVCLTAAFGAGALMANTGFDTTMQGAWQRGVEPTQFGTFFSDCKVIGEGKYALPIFGAAAVTGLIFEGNAAGDVVGEWGSRTLRMFVVGAPPLYALQWATGASRPAEQAGSQWHSFADNNGVSGHAFVGAIPFLAAADMVESPLLKGTLYVCSTFVGFSRMTDNAHFPSQVFLGWYLAWASSRAVSATEMHFADMEVRVVPLPMADLGGMAVEARW
ncbi:MAG: phosphatase PAP2 family protein [Planctomycetaceae bacterium]